MFARRLNPLQAVVLKPLRVVHAAYQSVRFHAPSTVTCDWVLDHYRTYLLLPIETNISSLLSALPRGPHLVTSQQWTA